MHFRNFLIGALCLASLCGTLTSCQNQKKSDYCWEKDLQHRLAVDFCASREDVKAWIQKNFIPDVTEAQIDAWTASGALETMEINGELKYFKHAAANLFRIDPECIAIKAATRPAPSFDPQQPDNADKLELTAKADGSKAVYTAPHTQKIRYTLTVDADAVPAGETIRCWLPLPIDGKVSGQGGALTPLSRQYDVKLLATSPADHTVSDDASEHHTVYMEAKAVAGQPTVFQEEFEFTACGEYHLLSSDTVAAEYDTASELYRKYTAERPPHIVFSDRIKHLADSLSEGLTHPVDKAKAFFNWIDDIPWASAREYSTIPNIPEYELDVRHGDCGQVTLLFMTMCRYAGIPAHFQSGFTMQPGDEGLHDWSEIYFEGVGWVPVDMSRGKTLYGPDRVVWFNLGGMDSWRMVVTNDHSGHLTPEKKFPRSETVDFQRGEVEWAGGNIYFDQWDYELEVI